MDGCVSSKLENINIFQSIYKDDEFPGSDMVKFIMYKGDIIPKIYSSYDDTCCLEDENLIGYIYGQIEEPELNTLNIDNLYICESKRNKKYSILLFLYVVYYMKKNYSHITDIKLFDGSDYSFPIDKDEKFQKIHDDGSVSIIDEKNNVKKFKSVDELIKKNIYFKLGFGSITQKARFGKTIEKYSEPTVEGWKKSIDCDKKASINTILERGRKLVGC